MSVVFVYLTHSLVSLSNLTCVLLRTRSFRATSRYFRSVIMSNLSIESISSCEIAGSDYDFLKPNSPDHQSTKSEVICNFSFKEPLPGTSFIVSGVILRTCERFSINLLAVGKQQDIALHFNPRLPQNYIVRNAKISGHWGEEETCSLFSSRYDLFRGHRFSIEILIADTEFLMSVNNRHFGAFPHRIAYKKLNAIEVKGDVKEVQIDQLYRECYPDTPIPNIMIEESSNDDPSLPVPYTVKIPSNFSTRKSIHIHAKVKMLPHSITINLQQKHYAWPHPVIALHINPRFNSGHHIVCRNSWVNGKWAKEERTEISARELCPGKLFKMKITADFEGYVIQINGQLFAEFKYRCDPQIVDTLDIFGDLVLKKVWIEEKKFD